MRKFLTCSMAAIVLLAVATPAESKIIGPTGGTASHEWRLEQRLARMSRQLHWYKAKTTKLQNQIDRLTRPTPTPAPSTTSAPSSYPSGVLSAEQVASYARGAGFPESVIPTMVSIAFRESRFNPGAINSSSGACGLWQIYPAQSGCTDPSANARMAYAKYAASGLSPWGG